MPKYYPIDAGVPLRASLSDLAAFEWRNRGIRADFFHTEDEGQLLRVAFERDCIVRLLDEMPLSTEIDDTPNEGLVSEHFAYRVEGALFAKSQSPAWKQVFGPVTHFQFITGWTCLDVLSGGTPTFSVVARAPRC